MRVVRAARVGSVKSMNDSSFNNENSTQKGTVKLLHTSTALCPECFRELPADIFAYSGDGAGDGLASGGQAGNGQAGGRQANDNQAGEGKADAAAGNTWSEGAENTWGDGAVYMTRTCPEHGTTTTRIWNNAKHYEWLRSLAHPKQKPPAPNFRACAPCPFGCGTCTRHERMGTLLEIEVTRNCNLHCPVCFMSADTGEGDPSLDEIGAMYDTIANAVGVDGAVQLTGGEPTCRADLNEIVRMGRKKGFWGIELNTNGLVVAKKPDYLESLVQAGLTGVYLSFDGVTPDVYKTTCGRDILDVKLQAVERCRECNIQVVLSVAVVAGLNDSQLGDILQFAMDNSDVVAGIALQPAFTSGRYDVENKGDSSSQNVFALTGGDVIFKLARQSEGLLEPKDIWPLGTSHPMCDSGVFLLRDIEEKHKSGFWPASKMMSMEEYRQGFNPHSPQGSVFLDILHKKGVQYSDGLSIIIMNYMDVHTMDTQRLRECSMMVTTPSGLPIPFCSYHLTDIHGKRIYPTWLKRELASDLSHLSNFFDRDF